MPMLQDYDGRKKYTQGLKCGHTDRLCRRPSKQSLCCNNRMEPGTFWWQPSLSHFAVFMRHLFLYSMGYGYLLLLHKGFNMAFFKGAVFLCWSCPVPAVLGVNSISCPSSNTADFSPQNSDYQFQQSLIE